MSNYIDCPQCRQNNNGCWYCKLGEPVSEKKEAVIWAAYNTSLEDELEARQKEVELMEFYNMKTVETETLLSVEKQFNRDEFDLFVAKQQIVVSDALNFKHHKKEEE